MKNTNVHTGVSELGVHPNGGAFVVPKNHKKCWGIFHLVELNGRMGRKQPSFYLPTLEDMAFLVEHHSSLMGGGLFATEK